MAGDMDIRNKLFGDERWSTIIHGGTQCLSSKFSAIWALLSDLDLCLVVTREFILDHLVASFSTNFPFDVQS